MCSVDDNDWRHLCANLVGPGCWRVIHCQTLYGRKTFLFVSLFIYYLLLLMLLPSPFPFAVTQSLTAGLMSQHHAIICTQSQVSMPRSSLNLPPLSPFLCPLPAFPLVIPPSFRLLPCAPPLPLPFPPLAVCLVFLLLALHFLCVSPPPPYAMSKACQSKPGRQSCHYSLW